MLIAFFIVLAIIVGAWAGIMFDSWTLDATYGDDMDPFSYYLGLPVQTVKRFWEILGDEIAG